MPHVTLPLVGLLRETVLPGEERLIEPPVVEEAALSVLAAAPPPLLCLLSIASPVELPSLVTARWGTECEVIAALPKSLRVKGRRRVRLLEARGSKSPYEGDFEMALDPSPPGASDVVRAAHALLAALELGGVPETPSYPASMTELVPALLRAVLRPENLRESLRLPPHEALRKAAQELSARAPGEHASCAVEKALRELSEKPDLGPELKRRLWSQIVEIQRRLDLYDPEQADEGEGLGRLQRKLQQAGLPSVAREVAKRELRMLRGMPTNHHDYSQYFGHLETIARLPWHPEPLPPVDLAKVEAALEREHSGLDKPKRRILEYLAVRALGGSAASTVLCLAGPPGVGKTSIARSIADSLGRKFVRVPLGGVHDECEIRGHRMSFVAASPGRIIAGMAQARSASVVMLLDEIDKMGTSTARSPWAALLEVLDAEQNHAFQDNYLSVPYDLSHVLFIATANDTSQIHPTLRDRLEIVELEGYTAREKIEIARRHLLDRVAKDCGLPAPLTVADEALGLIIERYTREPGVRELQRALASLHRARAVEVLRTDATSSAEPSAVGPDDVARVLGPPRHHQGERLPELPVGVAAGLSVGPGGGSLLYVEVAMMPGKGELRATGSLGEVLRETAHAARGHLLSDPEAYGVDADRLTRDFHVHLPEAATPKDGPSAGVALFCALVSAATGRTLRSDVAMTGEITLTGRVLPVGGVRAKVLAAERAGMRSVVLPEANRADVPEDASLEILFVRTAAEALRQVMAAEPAEASGEVMPQSPRADTAAQPAPQANG